MRIGRNIRAVRRLRGLTLGELSTLCGLSRDDLGLYERGQMTPRSETVKKIAQALEVPIVAIREGVGWTAPEPAEQWESQSGSPLHDGILETVRESCGEDLTLAEADIQALMASVKASIPVLVECMKDTRPEAEITWGILRELDLQPEDEEEGRYELTDEQWEQLRDMLPPERTGRGRAFKSNRLMLNGILYWMRSGKAWKDLPERYGRYRCVADRLRLWERTGVWGPLADMLLELGCIDEISSPRNGSGG